MWNCLCAGIVEGIEMLSNSGSSLLFVDDEFTCFIRNHRLYSIPPSHELGGFKHLRSLFETLYFLRRVSTPAVQAMVSYYTSKDLKGWRGRPRTSLPGTLSADLEATDAGKLSSLEDLHRIRKIAADRAE